MDSYRDALADLAAEVGKLPENAAGNVQGIDLNRAYMRACKVLDAPQDGPNARLEAALKNWDEEWGEVARNDSYAAPWDRELGLALQGRRDATSEPAK
jgi:hypothetical protein